MINTDDVEEIPIKIDDEKKQQHNYTLKLLPTACFTKFGYDYCAMINIDQYKEYFFNNYNLKITNNSDENTDIFVTSIYSTDKDDILFNKSKVNIIICIENLKNTQFRHYTHYNKFGEYGDKRIGIYIYNHIDKIINTPSYIAIPCIYFRIDYFKLKYDYYFSHSKLNKKFTDKKFCLIINKSNINKLINTFVNKLNDIGKIDHISIHHNSIIKKSCYNSIELLEVFNKYKFILCVENSYCDSYITEKIFNVFFSKSIPIYSGSPKGEYFFNKNSFINIIDGNIENCIDTITKLNRNEKLYNKYINSFKINQAYDDENYKEQMLTVINKLCN